MRMVSEQQASQMSEGNAGFQGDTFGEDVEGDPVCLYVRLRRAAGLRDEPTAATVARVAALIR